MCRAECSLSALENEAQVQCGFDHSIDGRIYGAARTTFLSMAGSSIVRTRVRRLSYWRFGGLAIVIAILCMNGCAAKAPSNAIASGPRQGDGCSDADWRHANQYFREEQDEGRVNDSDPSDSSFYRGQMRAEWNAISKPCRAHLSE
jgi:hypothetical protein